MSDCPFAAAAGGKDGNMGALHRALSKDPSLPQTAQTFTEWSRDGPQFSVGKQYKLYTLFQTRDSMLCNEGAKTLLASFLVQPLTREPAKEGESDIPAADEEEKKLEGDVVSSKQTPSELNHAPSVGKGDGGGGIVRHLGAVATVIHPPAKKSPDMTPIVDNEGNEKGEDHGMGESDDKGASTTSQGPYTSALRAALNSTHESGKGRELKFSNDKRGKKTHQNGLLWNRSLAPNPTDPGDLHWAVVLATEEATTAETRMLELAVVTSTTPHADGGPAHSVANGVVVAVPAQQGRTAQISCVVVRQATGQICNGYSWAVGLLVSSLTGAIERPPELVPFRVDLLKDDSFKGYLDPDEVKAQVASMLELALKDIVDAAKRKELEQNHRLDFQRAAEVSHAHPTATCTSTATRILRHASHRPTHRRSLLQKLGPVQVTF
jgi:hypothetical protein